MSKISLPINADPPLKTRESELYPLSIIFAKDDDKRNEWILNYYYTFAPDKYLRFSNDWWFRSENVFNTDNYIKMPKTVAANELYKNEIYKAIQKMMEQGFYCAGKLTNIVYNDNKPARIPHKFLLYEFDSQTKSFSSLSYLNGRSEKIIFKFDDLVDAIINSEDLVFLLLFYKLNEGYKYDGFDINKFKNEVTNYINPSDKYSGVNAVGTIVGYLRAYDPSHGLLSIKNLLILHEHKNLMFKRLKYLYNKKANLDHSLMDAYEKIVYDCKWLIETYNNVEEMKEIDKSELIAITIEKMMKLEINILSQVLENIF